MALVNNSKKLYKSIDSYTSIESNDTNSRRLERRARREIANNPHKDKINAITQIYLRANET